MSIFFAILAQTFPAENNTANEEASTGSVIGVIGGCPGPSPSMWPFLICRPQVPLGSGFSPVFTH